MKSFAYAAPGNLRDAIALLEDKWGGTEILAGGTDLVTCLKQNLAKPERVVSLRNIAELKSIHAEGKNLQIGATTSLADLAGHADVRRHFPALVTAAEGVGSTQMMRMGTVGGDLCQRPRCWFYRNGYGLFGMEDGKSLVREGDNRYHAIFSTEGPALFVSPSSLGPALIALGATITIAGPGDKVRRVQASEFFQIPVEATQRETVLKPNEILTGIEIPITGAKNATYEVRHRHGLDWPYVTASVALPGGESSAGRVVLGHVAPTPWRAEKASALLKGGRIDEALAAQCGEAATDGARPLSKNGYKVQLVKAAVKRAVLAAQA